MNYDLNSIGDKLMEKCNLNFAEMLISLITEEGDIDKETLQSIYDEFEWYQEKFESQNQELFDMISARTTTILNSNHFHGLSEFDEDCDECMADVRESELDNRDYYYSR